jgi:protease-4
MEFMDMSKLYEFAKVSPQTVKAGRYKDAGNPSRSLTEEEKGMKNKLIAGVHEQFINDILKKRKDKIKGDIHELAQGQIFSGELAKEFGLIDEIGSLWTAGRAIHQQMKLKGEFSLKYMKKKKNKGLLDLMDSLEEGISHLSLNNLIKYDKGPLLMYR